MWERGNVADQDLGELFTKFARKMVRLACSKCRIPSDGEDRVSEVFRRLQANPSVVLGNPKRFLIRAVINECTNWNMKSDRETKKLKKVIIFEPPPDMAELRDEINRAVLSLPEEQREVFVLKTDDDNPTMAEVADWIGIPETTAAARFRHACEGLRSKIKRPQEEKR